MSGGLELCRGHCKGDLGIKAMQQDSDQNAGAIVQGFQGEC